MRQRFAGATSCQSRPPSPLPFVCNPSCISARGLRLNRIHRLETTKNTRADRPASNREVDEFSPLNSGFSFCDLTTALILVLPGETRAEVTSGAIIRPPSPEKTNEAQMEDSGALPDIEKYRFAHGRMHVLARAMHASKNSRDAGAVSCVQQV